MQEEQREDGIVSGIARVFVAIAPYIFNVCFVALAVDTSRRGMFYNVLSRTFLMFVWSLLQ